MTGTDAEGPADSGADDQGMAGEQDGGADGGAEGALDGGSSGMADDSRSPPRRVPPTPARRPRCPVSTTVARTAGPTARSDRTRPWTRDPRLTSRARVLPRSTRLVGMPSADFAADVWSRAPLLTRAADLPRDFTDLFGADAVDELVARRGLRTPFARMARDGATLADRTFTLGGGVGCRHRRPAERGPRPARVRRGRHPGAPGAAPDVGADPGLRRRRSPTTSATRCRSTPTSRRPRTRASPTTTTSTTSSSSRSRARSGGGSAPPCSRRRCGTSPGSSAATRSPAPRRPSRSSRRRWRRATASTCPAAASTPRPRSGGTSIHLTIGVHTWTRRHLVDTLLVAHRRPARGGRRGPPQPAHRPRAAPAARRSTSRRRRPAGARARREGPAGRRRRRARRVAASVVRGTQRAEPVAVLARPSTLPILLPGGAPAATSPRTGRARVRSGRS